MSLILLAAESAQGGTPWWGTILATLCSGIIGGLISMWSTRGSDKRKDESTRLSDERKERSEREKESRAIVLDKCLGLLGRCDEIDDWRQNLSDARNRGDYALENDYEEIGSEQVLYRLHRAMDDLAFHAPDPLVKASEKLCEAAQAAVWANTQATSKTGYADADATFDEFHTQRSEFRNAFRAYRGLTPLPIQSDDS